MQNKNQPDDEKNKLELISTKKKKRDILIKRTQLQNQIIESNKFLIDSRALHKKNANKKLLMSISTLESKVDIIKENIKTYNEYIELLDLKITDLSKIDQKEKSDNIDEFLNQPFDGITEKEFLNYLENECEANDVYQLFLSQWSKPTDNGINRLLLTVLEVAARKNLKALKHFFKIMVSYRLGLDNRVILLKTFRAFMVYTKLNDDQKHGIKKGAHKKLRKMELSQVG